jgi:hypothetical protein
VQHRASARMRQTRMPQSFAGQVLTSASSALQKSPKIKGQER